MSNDIAGSWSDRLEETLIALILGLMTAITFANVIARVMNHNILWALEATVFLFAWLVLIGASYGVKKNFHIGVDVLVARFSPGLRRLVTLLAVAICIGFAIVLLIGAWNYWWPFASKRAFYEVNDIPMPQFLQFFADWLNEGEQYEKMPRFMPYAVLPFATALLLWRFVQAGFRVWNNTQELIIESHEFDDEAPVAATDIDEAIDFDTDSVSRSEYDAHSSLASSGESSDNSQRGR